MGSRLLHDRRSGLLFRGLCALVLTGFHDGPLKSSLPNSSAIRLPLFSCVSRVSWLVVFAARAVFGVCQRTLSSGRNRLRSSTRATDQTHQTRE